MIRKFLVECAQCNQVSHINENCSRVLYLHAYITGEDFKGSCGTYSSLESVLRLALD